MWHLSKKYNNTCGKSGPKVSNLANFNNIDFEISKMSFNLDPRYTFTNDEEHIKNVAIYNNVRMETFIKLVAVKI
jgi:hypothetical protein